MEAADRFFGLFNATEFDQCLAARFLGGHACAQIVIDVHLEMAFHLGCKIFFSALLSKQFAQPRQPST
jgi:hypothetical protein